MTSFSSSLSFMSGLFLRIFSAFLFRPVNQDALKTADNYNRQYYALIFIGLELAPQPFRRLPDFICKVVKLCFIYCGSHFSLLLIASNTTLNCTFAIKNTRKHCNSLFCKNVGRIFSMLATPFRLRSQFVTLKLQHLIFKQKHKIFRETFLHLRN